MALTKLNYTALEEEFCMWYIRYTNKLPNKNIKLTRHKLVKAINFYKRNLERGIK